MIQNTQDAAQLEIQAAAAALKVAPLAPDAQAQLVGCLAGRLAEAKALVSERESRLANIKFLLEPIYGSTNYAPIGGTLDRVLNICDGALPPAGPHYVLVGYNDNGTPCAALTVYAASAGLDTVKSNGVLMFHDAGHPHVKSVEAMSWPARR